MVSHASPIYFTTEGAHVSFVQAFNFRGRFSILGVVCLPNLNPEEAAPLLEIWKWRDENVYRNLEHPWPPDLGWENVRLVLYIIQYTLLIVEVSIRYK